MSDNRQLTAAEKGKRIVQIIESRADDFRNALPPSIPSNKFVRIVKTAIAQQPGLMECDPQALLMECQKAAADGLVVDGREATLTVFNTKKKIGNEWRYVKLPKYIPMYQGLIKRCRNTGELITIGAYLVHHNEATSVNPDTGEKFFRRWVDDAGEHVIFTPMVVGDPGPVIGGFSAAKLRDGTMDFCYLPISRLNEIKNRTRAKDKQGNIVGPWANDTEEMYKKTLIRAHSKTLPVDSDLARVFARDDDLYDNDTRAPTQAATLAPRKEAGRAAALLDAPEPDQERQEAKPEPAKAEAKTKAKPAQQPANDPGEPIDGEVIDGDAGEYGGDVI